MSNVALELNQPWAILPRKLAEIQKIYIDHLQGNKIDLKAIEAEIGRPLDNRPEPYWIENGVAVITIEGPIFKKSNLFTKISGGTSIELIARDFQAVLDNPLVKGIILYIDSPGGQIDNVEELSNLIFTSRLKKRTVAYTDGMMASAAYWIGSAAEKIYISGDTVQVGSIGVVAQHVDVSKAEEKMGMKTTEIVAGKYKRIASKYAPLSAEGKATIQEAVDYIYSVFVNTVRMNRGISEDEALSMADGKVFIGKQAIEAGLVDGLSSLDSLILSLSSGRRPLTAVEWEERLRIGAERAKEPKPKTAEEIREIARIQLAMEEKIAQKLKADEMDGLSARQQMKELVKEKMERDPSLLYPASLCAVQRENPKLVQKVLDEINQARKRRTYEQ